MTDQPKKITTQTLIPIGLFFTVISLLLGSMFWTGRLAEKVDRNTIGIDENKAWQAKSPTQYQFELLNTNINDLKLDIKELRQIINNLSNSKQII